MGFSLKQCGVPVVDHQTCTGCGQCVAICPDGVFALRDGKAWAGPGGFLGCIACGQCMAVCPTESIGVSGRDAKPDDRIPLPSPDLQANAEQLEALMTTRRSVRHFKPQEVPRALLDQIIRMASTAPMGIPPSEVGVVVLPGAKQVQQFAAEACASFQKMGRFLNPFVLALMRPFLGKSKYEAFRDFICPLMKILPEERGKGRDAFTYNAPAALIFHYGPFADAADCGIVVTYAMLAAEAMGLGNCMLGTSAALSQDKAWKAKYGIPTENKIGVTLILGYPAVTYRYAIRRRLASVRYVP